MARPLTKLKEGGGRYLRPKEVEDALDPALALDRQTQLQRAAISSRDSPDYLRDEVLVHLIREARRQADKSTLNLLVGRLFSRCTSKVRRNEPEVLEESLRALGLLIAQDGQQDKLDFFECKFERAFSVLCRIARRDITKNHSQLARDPEDADSAEQDLSKISQTALNPDEFRKLVLKIEGLEPELREAFVLVCIEQYKIESEDPYEVTAATLCQVEGRTIRNRVTKARSQLAEFLGDES